MKSINAQKAAWAAPSMWLDGINWDILPSAGSLLQLCNPFITTHITMDFLNPPNKVMKNVQIILHITRVICEICTFVFTLKSYLFARIYSGYASFCTILLYFCRKYYFLLVIPTLLILTDTLVLAKLNLLITYIIKETFQNFRNQERFGDKFPLHNYQQFPYFLKLIPSVLVFWDARG